MLESYIHFLSKNLLKILYKALIKSKLSYAITLWASAYKSDLHKFNVLNTHAVRCITFANRHTNLNTLYKKHKILKLNELQHYELGKHMFKLHNNETPLLLIGNYQLVRDRHNYNTRHSAKDNYVITLRHRKQDQNSFKYLGPKVWNSIPITIKNKTFVQFQKLYYDYLLENYT